MLSSEQEDERSVATKADQGTGAGYIIRQSLLKESPKYKGKLDYMAARTAV
jgi:hypothetical protein